ncbi:MAG: hypothetical protein AAGG75_01240 [Bacteroidota bacterium]
MKNLYFLIVLLISVSLIACGDTASESTGDTETTTQKTSESTAQQVAKEDMSNKTHVELAKAACLCFEDFYQFRDKVKKAYDGGDKEAYERNTYELKDMRVHARDCSRKVVAPLKGDDAAIASFERELLKACRHSSANILLLSRIKFKPG